MEPALSRRAPRQHRSTETVHAVLDAASELLATLSAEEITTSRIAAAAGLSVGGLYRFYKDKQEIFDAIAVRDLGEFRESLRAGFSPTQFLRSPSAGLRRILDAYLEFLDQRPAFRTLALGRHISEATREAETNPDALLQDLLFGIFGNKAPKSLRLRIRIAAEVGDRVIAMAYREKTAKDRAAVLEELKEMLAAYLLR